MECFKNENPLIGIPFGDWESNTYIFILVCIGSIGAQSESLALAELVPALVRRKTNQLEKFIARRALCVISHCKEAKHQQLYCLELLYLWNVLPSCNSSELQLIITG